MGKKAKLGKFRKDKFYKLAKETGFRSRAAFKLIQLNRKFGFLQESQVCIDLCAAPGGWMQVAKQNMPVSSIVIGVDLYPIRPIPGCISLIEDITTDKCKQSLTKELQSWKADCVLHDGAPNVGKNWLYDAYQQICLTLNALKLSTNFLRKGGWFITKVFRSKDYNALLWVLKQLFKKVHATKPSASRKESAEIFIVCQSYLAPEKIDPKLLDPKYVFEELDLEGKKQSTLLHPDKQKRIKAEGYTEKDISSRSEISVTEFMESKNALAALQGVSSIKIDHNGVRNHPRTTSEIVECCKDIKVLGRKDVKSLLNWWKHVKADLFKESTEDEDEKKTNEEPPRPLTEEEIEEKEFEELEEKILELKDEERREEKRKRKKIFKEKAKLSQKMNLKMVIKGDQGPTEQAEDEIFDLREIKTKEDLENLQDVSPDYVEEEQKNDVHLPKYKKFDKDNKILDDEGRYEDAGDSAPEESNTESESDYDKEGLGLSDEDDAGMKRKKKLKKKKKQEDHPLIKSSDFRDKDTKRKQRVQLWFEKENLQKFDTDDDEDFDLDKLANEYKNRGVAVLGEDENNEKKVVIKRRHSIDSNEIQTSSSDDDDDNSDTTDDNNYDVDREMKAAGDQSKSKEPKTKKIRLTEKELAIGAMMVKGRKTKRDLIDLGWNRYAFNDENLPTWFVQDEELHMRKDIPVPAELTEEYENKVRELNVRPIKKVMEAKARKKKRALKRLAKAQKKAEQILDNADASAQEKMRQIKKLYKKAEDKKKELTYVVAKKHLAGKRVRRPPNVKGRFKVVDPRMKKDKRAEASKQKKSKGKKK